MYNVYTPGSLVRAHLLYSRIAMTMQMMKTTARTGPTTQIRPSSSSMIGWGSISAETTGSEYGLVAYMVYKITDT